MDLPEPRPEKGRYVMVGFADDADAMRFIDHLAELDEMTRELLTATRKPDGKGVILKKFRVRTAYLRDVP